MKTSSWILTATLVTVGVGAWALTADAQGKDKPASKPAAGDSGMDMQMPMPGAEHKLLAETVGKWSFKMKMNGPAGAMESTGTSERKMAMNGWYLEDSTHSTMMGMPFEGHGYTGYDTMKKKYVGTWLDSMAGGAIMPMEGTYDAASKSFMFTMDMPDQMSGQYVKMNIVDKMVDADHMTSTFTKAGSDGKGPNDFSIEYSRAK
jgi:hypothetical protein